MSPRNPHRPPPALKLLSLGAGVQSSTLLLLAAQGAIPGFDYALFADTGWEPPAVYRHLERLDSVAADAGIPILRVSAGNIRHDALDENHRFASMPLHVTGPRGERGMARRQCTSEYKIRPLKKEARRLLGYPHPARVPEGVYAEQSIGISTDEVHRAKDADVRYLRNRFPLLDIGWTRRDCRAYLTAHGLADTPRSACIGCPYRSNESWAELKATDPAAFEDAVDFDAAIRQGHPGAAARGMPQRGTYYLHRHRVPLSEVDLGTDTGPEPEGCSPWACRGEQPGTESPSGGAA
ncbi:3'-phosphoadenosine 5'-phosphosulfate sulfotransferase (PAPS reductase)/FAD synthetase [Murinocardiopsis flavida]|uniref:3'-phosphoadenosine 5'-phosphosulfate sulfotransferase (PAPS reductase)/FAD synthetase n=1 Tax=Murinocardiopsis flavida TaxID=645275 RepID=A0A2P8CYB1_9ACTN|nr:hypothetical protein [Murinocardiopsis flavida]PSK89962.1 3'-phosphoadenosine 5'-phosphosulfate sulfotransferase (PAPS reductase)/FAD synthetase [Murinocardiopsis flavida]